MVFVLTKLFEIDAILNTSSKFKAISVYFCNTSETEMSVAVSKFGYVDILV